MRLVTQQEACGPGEPYEPIDVNALFDEPTVALRGPWGSDLVKIAPAADDLSAERYEYHLDFPGNALDPGCGYEHWANRITQGSQADRLRARRDRPRPPGKARAAVLVLLRLQRLEQHARGRLGDDPAQLRRGQRGARRSSRRRREVGYSQHEGAERAAWDDPKLELVGRHAPGRLPGRRLARELLRRARSTSARRARRASAATTRAGRRTSIGTAGADDPERSGGGARGVPVDRVRRPLGRAAAGVLQRPDRARISRPSGTTPITWSEDWRDRSVAVPGGGALGTGATDFFCGAIAAGSNALRRSLDEPLLGLGAARRAHRPGRVRALAHDLAPVAPLRLARRRAWGQILAAAARMYSKRLLLFLGIGILALPISVVVTILQAALIGASSVLGVETEGERGGRAGLRRARDRDGSDAARPRPRDGGRARALVEIDAGRPISPLRAYRLALRARLVAARRARDRRARHLGVAVTRCS